MIIGDSFSEKKRLASVFSNLSATLALHSWRSCRSVADSSFSLVA